MSDLPEWWVSGAFLVLVVPHEKAGLLDKIRHVPFPATEPPPVEAEVARDGSATR